MLIKFIRIFVDNTKRLACIVVTVEANMFNDLSKEIKDADNFILFKKKIHKHSLINS